MKSYRDLNFIINTHKVDDQKWLKILNEYNELGKKIFNFTKYVEREWK